MNTQKLNDLAVRIAKEIEAEFGPDLRAEGSRTKKRIVDAIKRKLSLRIGRPRSARLDQAEALRARGMGYAQIAATLNPDFWKLPKGERFWRKEAIRAALGQRRRAKKNAATRTPPTIATSDTEASVDGNSEASIKHDDQDA